MNAIKHGILSKEVVVHGSCINESDEEFAALHQRLWENLSPAGPLEEMLVDQIATAHWRLRRALKAESGEIALSVDGGNRQRNSGVVVDETIAQWERSDDVLSEMSDSALGNAYMQDDLKKLRASVELTGELTEAAINKVTLSGEPYALTAYLHSVRKKLQANPEGLDEAALRVKQKDQALTYLDEELHLILENKTACEEREKREEEARQAAALLPDPAILDKILRYETKLERQLFVPLTNWNGCNGCAGASRFHLL